MTYQIALIDIRIAEAIQKAEVLEDLADVFEIGTPLVLREGVNAIRSMRKRFPDHEISGGL